MSIADDYAYVQGFIESVGTLRMGSPEDVQAVLATLARVKTEHQRYLDAAMRVTDLANEYEGTTQASRIRAALGPAYLGGPLQ